MIFSLGMTESARKLSVWKGAGNSHPSSRAAEELGCKVEAPFQLMAFLALSVIPSLKITDKGLVDVDRFELVPLEAG